MLLVFKNGQAAPADDPLAVGLKNIQAAAAAPSVEEDEGGSEPVLCPVRLRAPFAESKQQLVAFIAQNFSDTATVAEGWDSKQGQEIPGRALVLVHKGAPSLPGLYEQSFIAPPEPVRYARRPFREVVDHSTDPGLETEWTFHRERLGLEV